MTVSRRQTHLG